MVICLTTPAAHYPIIKQALLAGKHVFSEKMIAVDLWQGKELVQIAERERGRTSGRRAQIPSSAHPCRRPGTSWTRA